MSDRATVKLDEPLDVLHEYFDRIDRGDTAGAAALFSSDARARFMLGPYFEGREQIATALGGITTDFARTSHHVTNVREVVREPNRAELHLYVYAYHRLTSGQPWHMWGRLRDVLVRHGDSWLIAEHVLRGVDAVSDRRRIPQAGYEGHPGREWEPLPDPGDRAREALVAVDPGVSESIEALRIAAELRGPIPPGFSALIAACAAAALRFDIGCRTSLERARKAGLSSDEAWAAAALLLRARGQAIAYPFADALLALYPRPTEHLPAGQAPSLADEGDNDADAAYRQLLSGGSVPSKLSPVIGELVLCGITAAERQADALRQQVGAARRAGAGDSELIQAVLAVVPIAGSAAYAVAESVLKS